MGSYRILKACGSGKLSEVYCAQNLQVGRKVAIRLMHNVVAPKSAQEEEFLAFGKKLVSLSPEEVACCQAFGILGDGRPYLVYEWLEGDRTEAGSSGEVLEPAVESIAEALGENSSGLVPANISIDNRGKKKLAGFDWIAGISITNLGNESRLVELKNILGSETAENGYQRIASELQAEFSSDKMAPGLQVGALIDDSYRILSILGQGGMGCVYEAEHTRLPQRVAIKVISGSYTEDSLVRFRREAEISSSLGHPNIVKVYDFNTLSEGTPYMVMEYLEGEELSKAISKGPFSLERSVRIVRGIGSALSAVHDIGVVHRDLKPQNVFLRKLKAGSTAGEHAMVLDFGVSKRIDAEQSLTVANAVVGTPRYMSPEQAKGENEDVSALSDQFALGVLAYEMLAGRPAFTRGDISEVIYRVCHVDPPKLASLGLSLPDYVSAAVERAMSKVSKDRFSSVAAFVSAFCGEDSGECSVVEDRLDVSEPVESDNIETVATVINQRVPKTRTGDSPPDPAKFVEEQPSTQSRTPVLVWGILLAGFGLVALGTVKYWGADESSVSTRTGVENTRDARVDGAVVAEADAVTDAGEAVANDPVSDAHVTTSIVDASRVRRPEKNASPSQGLSQAAQLAYVGAKKLLQAGRYQEARRVIGRTPALAKSSQGRALTVKSYCGEGNFGAAKDWIARVNRSSRGAVRKYCSSRHGIDL